MELHNQAHFMSVSRVNGRPGFLPHAVPSDAFSRMLHQVVGNTPTVQMAAHAVQGSEDVRKQHMSAKKTQHEQVSGTSEAEEGSFMQMVSAIENRLVVLALMERKARLGF
jgi:hypothetical protein